MMTFHESSCRVFRPVLFGGRDSKPNLQLIANFAFVGAETGFVFLNGPSNSVQSVARKRVESRAELAGNAIVYFTNTLTKNIESS
jgi:hypothetical protein